MKTSMLVVGLALLFAAAPVRAEDQVEPPVPVRTAAPIFPYQLRHEGVSGIVFVSCLIDTDGNVSDTKVVKASDDGFVRPALDAIKKWKFKPAQRDGNNISCRVNIPIRFNIDD
jgi:protein TonB